MALYKQEISFFGYFSKIFKLQQLFIEHKFIRMALYEKLILGIQIAVKISTTFYTKKNKQTQNWRKKMKKFSVSVITILFSVVLTFSQTTTGRLNGSVSGPDGVLPNATITVKDNKTEKEVTATSKEDGNFLFPQLEFGTYTVTIAASGFKTFVANELKIDVGRDYTLNPILEIGNVQETVTVTAGADVVTSTTAQVSNTVSPQQILSLPLIDRNPLNLITLQAGTASNPNQNTSINGLRTTFTNITRDGINIQDTFIRTNATDFAPGRPSVDDTGEFTIATSNQEADQGYGGAQIRLVTPRGTKDFHGALFAYNRNSAFAANGFFNNRNANPLINEKPAFRNRNQYGGKLLGPLPIPAFGEGTPFFYKDKGFFFFAYEGIKDPISSLFTRTILTPSARSGVFTYNRATAGAPINTQAGGATVSCPSGAAQSVCTISNILAFGQSQGFSNIPSTTDATIQSRVISQLPTASNFTGGDGLNTAGFALNRQQNQNRDTYTTRIDLDATEKDSFNGVFSYNNETNLRPDADTTKFTVTPGVTQISTNKTFALAYRRIISNNFVNEVRGGLFTSEVPFNRLDATPTNFLSIPLVTFPENTFLSQGRNTKAINFQDNADYIIGKHSLRFGGQLQYFIVNSYNDALIVPVISIGTNSINAANNNTLLTSNFANLGGISTTQVGTANGLLSLLGGLVNGVSQQFNTTTQTSGFSATRLFQPFRYQNHSLYVSDRWSIARGLTLSLGVRYELFPALKLDSGLALEPVITNEDDVVASLLNSAGTYNFVGTNAGKKNQYYKTDYNNFAPSIGVAYTPNFESGIGKLLFGTEGKTVLRGGYSQVYGNDSIITSINNAAVGNVGLGRTGNNAVNSIAGSGTTQLNDRLSGTVTPVNPPTFIAPPRTYLQNNSAALAGNFGTVFAVDPNLSTPKVEQYSFGIQREFFGNLAVEARYVGSRSKNLVRGIDFNQVDIFNNGFLADFNRASSNLALTTRLNPTNAAAQTAFCNPTVVAGCQTLTIFQSGAGASGRLGIGTGGLAAATFNNALRGGTPADLAISFITNGVNNHPTVANPTATPFVRFLANPATGVANLMLNGADYNYNSLQLEVRRRFAQGLYLQANYTFSKNLTNAIGTSQQLFEPFLDINNQDLDYQRADFDQTHTFNFNGIYQLPFGKGKMFLNQGGFVDKLVGGFEISGLLQTGSGSPITFVDPRGTLNRTGRSTRQTVVTSLTNEQVRALAGVFEANGNVYFIDPSIISPNGEASVGYIGEAGLNQNAAFAGQVFFNTSPGQTGNLQRAIIDGPRTFNVNATLIKNINFTETIRVQLRAEAFNLFNNVTFFNNTTGQLSNINSTTFGQLNTTFDPRRMQFAARFEF